MAKLAAKSVRAWIDEIDISGYINAATLDLTQEVPEVTCFSDDGPRRVTGNYDHKSSHNGFFDSADDSFDEQVFANFNTEEDHYLVQLFGGQAEGSIGGKLQLIRLSGQPRSAKVGDAQMLNIEAAGSGGLAQVTVLANAALSGTGTRTGRNMGITTTPRLFVASFHLFAFNGTNITMKVQESSDDAGGDPYADIAGLTSGALVAPGQVYASTTATTEAWKRIIVSGTFTTATIGVVAGSIAGT